MRMKKYYYLKNEKENNEDIILRIKVNKPTKDQKSNLKWRKLM